MVRPRRERTVLAVVDFIFEGLCFAFKSKVEWVCAVDRLKHEKE